jgi:hypothetical protein
MAKSQGSKPVSQARLHQKANSQPVRGVAKINHGNGTFSMKKSSR